MWLAYCKNAACNIFMSCFDLPSNFRNYVLSVKFLFGQLVCIDLIGKINLHFSVQEFRRAICYQLHKESVENVFKLHTRGMSL